MDKTILMAEADRRLEATERRASLSPPAGIVGETPETDEFARSGGGRRRQFEWVEFARSLERRLREAEAENKRILELHKGLMAEADKRLEAAERRVEREGADWGKLYHELLYAVGNKYPNETRHQTALHYIQRAERGSDHCNAKSAARKESDDKG